MKYIITSDGYITAEIDSDTQKAAFAQIAQFQEVFVTEPCGICKNEKTVFRTREAKTAAGKPFTSYSQVCTRCGASLTYGTHADEKTMFPQRKDKDTGMYNRETRGWKQWNKDALAGAAASAPARQPASVAGSGGLGPEDSCPF
jgi:Tfp pilus assembly protein PilE